MGNPSRPSELRRQIGLCLKYRFAIIRCKCKNHLIVTNGQQTRSCPRCGRRFWLNDHHVVFQSDDFELVRKLLTGVGNYYRPDGFTPASELYAHRLASTNVNSAGEYRALKSRLKQDRESVATST